jgi:hypothetical protein
MQSGHGCAAPEIQLVGVVDQACLDGAQHALALPFVNARRDVDLNSE